MTEPLWLTGKQAYEQFKKGHGWLRKFQIPAKDDPETKQRLYDPEAIRAAIEAELPPMNSNGAANTKAEGEALVVTEVAVNVRETARLLQQVHTHLEKMSVNHEQRSKSLFDTLTAHLDKQNAQVIALEQKALEMRIATENAMSLEHERKLATDESEKRGRMQEEALRSITSTLGPWLQQKLGHVAAPATAATAAAPSRHEEKVGAFTIKVLASISDAKFAELEGVLGTEVFQGLAALRSAIQEGSIQ